MMKKSSQKWLIIDFFLFNIINIRNFLILNKIPFRPQKHSDNKTISDKIGICVAPHKDSLAREKSIQWLKELGVKNVRIDLSFDNNNSDTDSFIRDLNLNGFKICLHLVQQHSEASMMPDAHSEERWRRFVASALDRYRSIVELVEIGSTCNRRKWSGYSPKGWLSAWTIAYEEARKRNMTIAGPNVTDFEPVYNIGILGSLSKRDLLPDIHTNNLFAERAGEPEAFDHKIAGRAFANALKMNLVRKAYFLDYISQSFGINHTYSTHAAWSFRRLARLHSNISQKQADYLVRYCCLLSSAGTPERIYWGPMIGQREGLIDDGTNEYPEIPHVTFYGEAKGRIENYKIRPAFNALKTFISFTNNTIHNGSPCSGNGLEIHSFVSQEKQVHIVWTTDGNCADPYHCYDKESITSASFYSIDGRRLSAPPTLFNETPVYVLWDNSKSVNIKEEAGILKGIRLSLTVGCEYRYKADSNRFGIEAVSNESFFSIAESLENSTDKIIMRDRRNKVMNLTNSASSTGKIAVKKFRIRGLYKRAIQRRRKGKAIRSWNGAHELLRRGIQTPKPLAFIQPYNPVKDSYYICEYIKPDVSLRQVFEGLKKGKAKFMNIDSEEWYKLFALFLAKVHSRGIFYRDLSPGNILITETSSGCPIFWLIDTGRAKFFPYPISRKLRLLDIRRALHPLHWAGRRKFIEFYLKESNMKSNILMLWPILRYDIKHFIKDRIRGKRKRTRKTTK